MRMGPAPRAQRKPNEGPIVLTPRPSRNSGARVVGTYDVPANQYVHVQNEAFVSPHWIGDPGGLVVGWGSRFYGTGSTLTGQEQFMRGVTLWGIDDEDNPYVVDQVDAYGSLGAFNKNCIGDTLGDQHDAGFQIYGRDHAVVTRVILGALTISTTPQFQARAWRVVGESITQGDYLAFQMFTVTEPVAMNDSSFIQWPYQLQTAGLAYNDALLAGFADTLASYPMGPPKFVLWRFNPFNLAGTLRDSGATIMRQPDVVMTTASLGLAPNIFDWRLARRTSSEAVAVFQSYTSSTADMQVNVIRFSPSGTILSNTLVVDADAVAGYSVVPPATYMGSDTVMSGGLRVSGAGVTDIGLEPPFYSGFVDLQSFPWQVDDDSYIEIRKDIAANPDVMTYTIRSLGDDSPERIVYSYADQDDEVHDMAVIVLRVAFGPVATSQWMAHRAANPPYSTVNQVVIIELGAGRQAGTAQVVTEDRRFHRLPQGLS